MIADLSSTRADRHADADFPSPLSHRNEHDVHDADPADEKGNGGNCGRQPRNGFGRGVLRSPPPAANAPSLRRVTAGARGLPARGNTFAGYFRATSSIASTTCCVAT